MVKCICINDENKPSVIPKSKWIVKDKEYTITHVYFHKNQESGIQGVSLYEIFLDESCSPYETFKLSRFAININDLNKLIELIKNCTELNDLDITKLIEESELEIIEGETA